MCARPLASVFVASIILVPAAGRGQETARDEASAAAKQKAEERLTFMKGALGRYRIFVGDDRTPAALLPAPVLRWNNPVSGVQDGVVGVFTTGGRPTVIAQFAFHGGGYQAQEFYSVTGEPFEMKRGERTVWKPAKAAFAFQDLKEGPKPAKSASLRLPQMRQIAAEFSVVDDFGWDKKEKQNLRLMTQPLHRYVDDARGVVDGALFTYCMGTNPEANMLLELVRSEKTLKWQFGFSPMTIYALTASRKDEEVWSIEERKIFNSYAAPFHVGEYPQEPGETVPD